jgi:hypothetical protein
MLPVSQENPESVATSTTLEEKLFATDSRPVPGSTSEYLPSRVGPTQRNPVEDNEHELVTRHTLQECRGKRKNLEHIYWMMLTEDGSDAATAIPSSDHITSRNWI